MDKVIEFKTKSTVENYINRRLIEEGYEPIENDVLHFILETIDEELKPIK